MLLTPAPEVASGNQVREPVSKRHPECASVASLRLFTIDRNDVHDGSEYEGRRAYRVLDRAQDLVYYQLGKSLGYGSCAVGAASNSGVQVLEIQDRLGRAWNGA